MRRNASLAGLGLKAPTATKTGTTIAGVVFAGGVVLGADTRSTNGDTVADKNCEKIHYIAPNIFCCGAGTAADTEAVTGAPRCLPARPSRADACPSGMVSSALELHRYAVGRSSRVVTALTLLKAHLFRYHGRVSAALVLGGVDFTGPHLHTVYPHGSTDTLPFVTMGSGSLAAMSVFEADYTEDMDRAAACALVARAIKAGIFNDLGSGSNVDLCVITAKGKEYLRNYETPNERTHRRTAGYSFPVGTTKARAMGGGDGALLLGMACTLAARRSLSPPAAGQALRAARLVRAATAQQLRCRYQGTPGGGCRCNGDVSGVHPRPLS